MKILLIEPNKIMAKTYQAVLEKSSHVVTIRSGAQSAIFAIDESGADIIILEPQLVGHSGIEFLYELRSYADLQHIPVILHTFIPSEAFLGQMDILDTLGVFKYLYKPQTSLKELVKVVSSTAKPIAV